ADVAYVDVRLVFRAQPDSIIVSNEVAGRNRLSVGQRLTLGTVEGEKPFTIRGVMKASGLTSAFGGNLAIMDVYAAQKMFGRGRSFDRIDVGVKPGTTIGECEDELRRRLGQGFQRAPTYGSETQTAPIAAGPKTHG